MIELEFDGFDCDVCGHHSANSKECVKCLAGVNYGLNGKQLQDLLDRQEGLCWVCYHKITWDSSDKNAKRLAVDHDHRWGKKRRVPIESVRGLMCGSCNIFLGQVESAVDYEPQAVLKRLARYVELVNPQCAPARALFKTVDAVPPKKQ